MRKYHGPKDYLDAAQDPRTSATELAFLARSEYGFVRSAVAKHSNVTEDTLLLLAPSDYSSSVKQDIAVAVAGNPKAPPEALERIARGVLPLLDNRRGNTRAFQAGVRLCCHANTPTGAVAEMLDPNKTAVQFRKVVARESNRSDALALLASDPSVIVMRALARRSPVA